MNHQPDLGPTELLLGFFEFYSDFNDANVIAPARNPPFRTFTDLKEELMEKVDEESIFSHIELMFKDSYFKIQDPYDFAYNPARAVKKTSLNAKRYPQLF